MAEVLLFHHAQGLTEGVRAFADDLRAAGHAVNTPDLYEGQTFSNLGDGVAHAKSVGFDVILKRGRLAAEALPAGLVYAGFSLGVLPAQMLAQTRRGARGALLLYSAFPLSEFGEAWPRGVPLQIHAMTDDEWFSEDRVAADELVAAAGAELFLYPGNRHLFADRSVPDYESEAAALLTRRVLAFLETV
jgi:dienelactone hydrolase